MWLIQSGVAEKWEKCKAGCVDGKVPAAEFADAALAIISVFDLISGMGIAKADMNGNAKAIAKFAEENPGKSLQELCEAELSTGDLKKLLKGGSACCALLWLQRALLFIKVLATLRPCSQGNKHIRSRLTLPCHCCATRASTRRASVTSPIKAKSSTCVCSRPGLQAQILLETLESDRSAKLSECVMKGYEASLKRFHGFAVRTTFSVAVKAAPSRDGFMAKLAPTEEEVFQRIGAMMPTVNEILKTNDAFLRAKGVETA